MGVTGTNQRTEPERFGGRLYLFENGPEDLARERVFAFELDPGQFCDGRAQRHKRVVFVELNVLYDVRALVPFRALFLDPLRPWWGRFMHGFPQHSQGLQ